MFKVGTTPANMQNSASRFYRQNTGLRRLRRSAHGNHGFAQIVQHGGNRIKPQARCGMDGGKQAAARAAKPRYCVSQIPMMRWSAQNSKECAKVSARLDWAGDGALFHRFFQSRANRWQTLQRIFPRCIQQAAGLPSALMPNSICGGV